MDFQSYIETTMKKSDIPVTATSMIQYPTGFMHLDYGAGSYMNVYDDDTPVFTYHNIGIRRGSVNVLISKSQGGKTTLSIKMGASIIESFMNSIVYQQMIAAVKKAFPKAKNPDFDGMPFIQILDTEKTLPVDYVQKITRYTNKMTHRHIMINPITTDKDLIKCLEQHVRFKVEHMKQIMMPMLDMYGNLIYEYPPTIFIIDSTSQLLMEDCDDPSAVKSTKTNKTISDIYDENVMNTAGARRAKIITALYSQLVNYAAKYNIIIFSINHINKLLPVNGMPVKQYRGLRAGETIGGGERAIFLASTILRLDVIKNVSSIGSTSVNLGEDVRGHIATASWIKSKSNSKSNVAQLIYTNECGYDQLLSNVWMLKETGKLGESNHRFYLPGFDDIKFTMKNCKEVFAEHPELITPLYDRLRVVCEPMLDNPDSAIKAEKKLMEDIRKDIHEEYGKSDAMDMDDLFSQMINQ